MSALPKPSSSSIVTRVRTSSKAEDLMRRLLEKADIRLGGDRPWDLRLNVAGVPERLFAQGSLGFGEAYTDGGWDVDQLDEFFCRILRARLDREVKPWTLLPHILRSRFLNLQNMRRAWQVGAVH